MYIFLYIYTCMYICTYIYIIIIVIIIIIIIISIIIIIITIIIIYIHPMLLPDATRVVPCLAGEAQGWGGAGTLGSYLGMSTDPEGQAPEWPGPVELFFVLGKENKQNRKNNVYIVVRKIRGLQGKYL